MARKLLFDLRVKAESGKAVLYFGKGTPAYQADPEDRNPLNIRIYRKEEPGFVFGQDYLEYFDGIDPREADLIFEGRLPAKNGKTYMFADETAEIGRTYAYWVTADGQEAPTGPVPVRVRDPLVWWPRAAVEGYMDRLAAEFPALAAAEEYGRTVRGRPIRGLVLGNRRRCVALVGLVHAGESGPELMLPAAERLLRECGDLLADAGLALLPAVNIDMRELQTEGVPAYLRTNFNGVDINRNFPAHWETVDTSYGQDTSDPHVTTYRGEAPFSEPETRALAAFAERTEPLAAFSFHCLASICGDRFLTSKFAEGDRAFAERAVPLLEAYTEGFGPGERPAPLLQFECTAGSFPSWMYLARGVPAFDLEYDGRPGARAALTDGTTRELLREYQERHYRGIRRVLERIRDEEGSGHP